MNNKGFTLVEVMMAMVIFSITFMASTSMLISTIKLNTTGNMQTLATFMARDKIESLMRFRAIDMTEGTFSDQPGPAFTRSWTISPTNKNMCKRISVRVSWKKFRSAKYINISVLHIAPPTNGLVHTGVDHSTGNTLNQW